MIAERVEAALNRLAKWRTVLAGWQLGTRAMTDPECAAVRDHREATILLRAELNALIRALTSSGVLNHREYLVCLEKEAALAQKEFERRFPGFKASDDGIDVDTAKAAETMHRMGFKP